PDTRGLGGGDAEGVDQAGDLAARVADRLPGLDAQRQRQFLGALAETAHAMLEHVAAAVGGERGHRLARREGGGDGPVDGRRIDEGGAGGDLAAVLVQHLEIRVRLDRAVGQVAGIAPGEGAGLAVAALLGHRETPRRSWKGWGGQLTAAASSAISRLSRASSRPWSTGTSTGSTPGRASASRSCASKPSMEVARWPRAP